METKLTVRIPQQLQERLEDMADNPPAGLNLHGKVKVSTVVREAILRGLEVLDRERRKEKR